MLLPDGLSRGIGSTLKNYGIEGELIDFNWAFETPGYLMLMNSFFFNSLIDACLLMNEIAVKRLFDVTYVK